VPPHAWLEDQEISGGQCRRVWRVRPNGRPWHTARHGDAAPWPTGAGARACRGSGAKRHGAPVRGRCGAPNPGSGGDANGGRVLVDPL